MSSDTPVFPGADERTPSRAQYFSWINNTNEGATARQTAINLEFFAWLRREYGMVLDIYAFDAGAIDGAKFYGSTDSERFRRQFPEGFGPLAAQAGAMGCRLGVWGGPDGFGDTPEEARARIEMMTGLCRDFNFALFKFDGVCGPLRPEKQDAFVEMMTACRRYSPDLILLNHRLQLGKGMPHATTWLWEGVEMYIDAIIWNTTPAPHNRGAAISRGVPPNLARLTEDHGVCLSSCLDYWEDDLIIQAFNRGLILAPEIYGNPWLLRDDEFPKLARIYNLHRRYRDILVDGMLLPEEAFGPYAVARGDAGTRLLCLRNLTWEPVTYRIPLDATIGLADEGEVEVRQFHPVERVVGRFAPGESVEVEVLPYRACLLLATTRPCDEPAAHGCDYEVVRDVPDTPLVLKLLGEPGTAAEVTVTAPARGVAHVERVTFPGTPRTLAWHRKLGNLAAVEVPADAEALYEATCFAADSNSLEVRELERSGPTAIPEVQRARDAFFDQPTLRRRNLWDRALFDDDPDTAFAVARRRVSDMRVRGGAFRLDLGAPTTLDRLVLEVGDDYGLQPLHPQEGVWASVSADLRTWRRVPFFCTENVEGRIPDDAPVRYIRLDGCPDRIRHVRGYHRGQALDRTGWRASNLLATYGSAPATHAWSSTFTLPEYVPGSYLCIALYGDYGHELAYAAVRQADRVIGAPRRSPSFPYNAWECQIWKTITGNYTYYVPVTEDMIGQPLDAVALLLRGGDAEALRGEVWVTAYPVPYVGRELVLE